MLGGKGAKYTEYKIDGDESARQAMAQRAWGKRSVPQIFINNESIVGCDDLSALDGQKKLDNLLAKCGPI